MAFINSHSKDPYKPTYVHTYTIRGWILPRLWMVASCRMLWILKYSGAIR